MKLSNCQGHTLIVRAVGPCRTSGKEKSLRKLCAERRMAERVVLDGWRCWTFAEKVGPCRAAIASQGADEYWTIGSAGFNEMIEPGDRRQLLEQFAVDDILAGLKRVSRRPKEKEMGQFFGTCPRAIIH